VFRSLPRTVVVLSLVSFLNDMASDMVIPLLPILLSTQLAAGPIALGLIEGVADALASLLKLWAGRHSDLLGGKRKVFAVAGYSLSNIARPLLALAGSWVTLLLLRGVDRIGKGIRSAPRDAMIADSAPEAMRGAAFGFHRALDNAGAVLGSLIAAAVMVYAQASVAQIILWSALPGVLCVALLAFAVRDAQPERPAAQPRAVLPPLRWSILTPRMRAFLWVLLLFSFARASETFIVLRGHELGMSPAHLLVLWAALNLAKALSAGWGGVLADRFSRRAVMFAGWGVSAAVYLAMSAVSGAASLWAVSVAYGLFAGLSEGAERALIGDLAEERERGTAFGWYNMMLGIGAIPAGVLFGWIWARFGAGAAWIWAACAAIVAALMLQRVLARDKPGSALVD
jgi:MFS family permease